MPDVNQGVFEEKYFSPAELAKLLGLSVDTIRRLFSSEDGVLVVQRADTRKNARSYKTLRIPLSVALRVREKLTVKPTAVPNFACGVRHPIQEIRKSTK